MDNQTQNNVGDELVQLALDGSDEGRKILAESMANPIQTALMYQAMGRKILMVDPIAAGAIARYDRDIDVNAYLVPAKGETPVDIIKGEDFTVPLFELSANPSVSNSEVKSRMYNIIERILVKAKNQLSALEDTEIFKLIDSSVPQDAVNPIFNHLIATNSGRLTLDLINVATAKIERHRLTVDKMIMNATRYADIRGWGKDYLDFVTQREVLQTGVMSRLWNTEILINSLLPDNDVYVLAPAHLIGVMPVRQEITVVPADEPKKRRMGWVIFEEIGLAMTNPKGISKISVS